MASDSKNDFTLGDKADFMLKLCEAPCFNNHSEIVLKQADQALGCNEAAYMAALPVALARDGKSRATPLAQKLLETAAGTVNLQVASDANAAGRLTDDLNKLVIELGKGNDLDAVTKSDLDDRFKAIKKSPPGVANAIERAQFFLHNGSGSDPLQREFYSSAIADVELWKDAPCGVLEALSHFRTSPLSRKTTIAWSAIART